MTEHYKTLTLQSKDLVPYARNARTHSDEQVNQIASSIKEFGFTNPVIIDEDNGIIAGHGRIMAANKLGINEVPCVQVNGWSQAQKKAYVIADNKLALNAGWDEQLLSLEFQDLQDMDFDLTLTGFTDDEIQNLYPDDLNEGLTDEDEVPEAPEKPVTIEGDIWILGNHRLMCGDSTDAGSVEILMNGEKADMVFTDPPYGVDYDGGSKKREKLKDDHSGTDIYQRVVPIIADYCVGPCYVWYADTKPDGLYGAVKLVGDIHALIIWVKNNATFNMNIQYKQRHEPCLYWKPKNKTLKWSGPSNEETVWEINREASNNYHPTQKPAALAERAIKNHKADNVLDLFLGSGSTLIAAEKTGRKCYGMELDPAYCDVIIKRWQDYTGQKATMAGDTYEQVKEARHG
jgi:DNA modification methylase